MRITQKEFDKLKQLDRIEFRQKEEKIDKQFDLGFFSISTYMLYILLGLATLDIWTYFRTGYFAINLFIWILILKSFILISAFFICLGILFYIVEQIERRKLYSEYFKTEVKK
jgi:hypothetical protein